jgi:aminopeptidase N
MEASPPPDTRAAKLEKWGLYVWTITEPDQTYLQACEIGDYERGDFESTVDVTAPGSQAFLDDVNAALGTSFRLDQFAGR